MRSTGRIPPTCSLAAFADLSSSSANVLSAIDEPCQGISAAFNCRLSYQREFSILPDTTYVSESKKIKRFWFLSIFRFAFDSKPAKLYYPRLLFRQLQSEFLHPVLRVSCKFLCVSLVLKACQIIIGKTYQIRFTLQIFLAFLFEPQVQHIVEVNIGKNWANWSPL